MDRLLVVACLLALVGLPVLQGIVGMVFLLGVHVFDIHLVQYQLWQGADQVQTVREYLESRLPVGQGSGGADVWVILGR